MRTKNSKIWRDMRIDPLPGYIQPYVSGWGKRRLNRFRRTASGKLQQLHATRGWKFA